MTEHDDDGHATGIEIRLSEPTTATLQLAEGVALTLVKIPAGSFLMGSPEAERGRDCDESPQHRVELKSFFLGQTPVTQAQWQVVAGWPKRWMDLNPYPSHFNGANRPVEQVSWYEAMEFCQRLRGECGGLNFALPSEAQWEYACRAGTTTPFHFGETISNRLANYDGSLDYKKGRIGEYRRRTTDVASFPANDWGLYDMHGNVWEWCADHWHDTYEGAPEDGRAWIDNPVRVELTRLVRGGSWIHDPWICRSAYRFFLSPEYRYIDTGFRVCYLP
jgi:formylglycine-generating enzyme required for sulfatase activity